VLEVNAGPGLRMHLQPASGTTRDVGDALVASLYPPHTPSRIPLVAVTGTNRKTTTTRLIGHLMTATGARIGMTTTDGIDIDGERVLCADASGPWSAQVVLGDPTVDAAVLEVARGGLLRRGLGYDLADVAVLTTITADHWGRTASRRSTTWCTSRRWSPSRSARAARLS
jgi:cyanophycin synthetase